MKLKLARSWCTICTISCVCTEKYPANPVLHDTKLLQRVTRQRFHATKTWCRMRSEDLNAAIESGIAAVNLSLPASDIQLTAKLGLDRAGALHVIEHMVGRAAACGFFVTVGCEDASRAARDHPARVIETAARAGASRVRLSGLVGVLDPFSTVEFAAQVADQSPVDLEFHGCSVSLRRTHPTSSFLRGRMQ
ncbi:hypothetical protein FS320_29955 [Microvirga tunisiensis]|uniref:Homocitrate synthase n=1 Tax=Microvirga tunisiensis TaxID=2108360 RepID=A0A5N7MQB8_9HYPH|nr:hypothetical protein [Microvirga tunisiensis]MPR29211.1 hypothetical protein [Microvirga tunisiensis]